MPTVRFLREGIEVECEQGANLRRVAMEAGVEIYEKPWRYELNCHGLGTCGTCRVAIKNDSMDGASDLSLMEKLQFKLGWPLSPIPFLNFFDYIGKENELRLSCQISVEDDVDVYTQPEANFYGDQKWQFDVDNPAIAGKSSVSEAPPQTTWERGEMQDLEGDEE